MRYPLLANHPTLKALLRSRWPQFVLTVLALAGFIFAILAGLLGTPVGSRNFSIVFVWIAWWAVLMLVAVPLFGRGWCSICPIPAAGEWLQRGAVLGPGGKSGGLGLRWPNRLRNIWMQNGAFLLVALFSAVVLTQPRVTAIVLAALLFIALGVSLVFERRAFCRYLCPVGGFIGLYSQLAPLELRVVNPSVCAAHKEKTCYTGSAEGYGCPWQAFPGGLVKNTNCGLCMECLRTCPHDNIGINIRLPGADLGSSQALKLDEAYKAFILLGSAILYSAVLIGPWGMLKSAAYAVGSLPWFVYALLFLGAVLLALPGVFWMAVRLGLTLSGAAVQMRRAFAGLAEAMIPLGLAAWLAFSLSFVLANFSYIVPVLSDPLGLGWNLFGTAGAGWAPYLSGVVPLLQALVLLAGLVWSGRTAQRAAARAMPGQKAALLALPVMVFSLGITLAVLGLLVA